MKKNSLAALLSVLLMGVGTRPAIAQWQTQSLLIKPGWTAVYLFVDASYTNLNALVGSDPNNPIEEVWLWQPTVSSVQFINNPLAPVTGSSQWANWERLNTGLTGTLSTLAPNSAYLVHSTATTNYTWKVTGQPVAPSYAWSATAINLVGFPTVTNQPPALDTFLAPAAVLSAATIYDYVGGNLSSFNPSLVFAPHAVQVLRGQAFWINETNAVNNYFGPFQVTVSGSATAFGAGAGSATLRLINTTPSAVTVNLTLQPSEAPPAPNLAAIVGTPPIVVRGALNSSTLAYAVSNLSATIPQSWTLAPQGQAGSDIAVILGVNRTAMTGAPGALFAGILRFTDSSGYTEVDLPTSAQVGSYGGLWVGNAQVSQVSNYLKTYATNTDGTTAQYTNGPNAGAYIVTSLNTNLGATSASFPLRLIIHNDGVNVNLLQHVFYGSDVNSNTIVSTGQSALDPAQLGTARRISSVQFPWTPNNQPWLFSGQLAPGGALTRTVTVQYDDQASNPFLHTYHPDHDNLDSTFQVEQPIGVESYQIDRLITMQITPPGQDFNSLVQFGQTFSGAYAETITLTGIGYATRTFNVAGSFTLNRLSSISTLTQAP